MRRLVTVSRMMTSAQQPPPPQVWPEAWHRAAKQLQPENSERQLDCCVMWA
jgi:hypothetical protein